MKCSELLRRLKREGWIIHRSGKGSHKLLIHPDKQGVEIVFPDHGSDEIAKGLASRILKQAGLK
ncbi:type II toxin-antitoxin system HicA family toxin [Chitinophaga japonensis]|uniref:Putative RNA binding protein YcfA (HicA-like mRNA interferase family) n=1 Tax=Chitinophaga japonensis TaxID=104662 RepID=A0A562TBL5_CHIJA|nr:putative RNA binding protein YcfA (HicA-like mRNA interferase family) [Chitinophaga japonensis]